MLGYHSVRPFSSIGVSVAQCSLLPAGKQQYSGAEMSLRYIKISKYVQFHTVSGETEPEQRDDFSENTEASKA